MLQLLELCLALRFIGHIMHSLSRRSMRYCVLAQFLALSASSYNGEPCVPFSLPILRISLSCLRSVSSIQQRRQDRPSLRQAVSLPQRTHGLAGILRFTSANSATSLQTLLCYFSSAAVCLTVRTTGK